MHLFLSPHYDDAVLSVGGLIHRLVQQNNRVVVRTVMGGKPSADKVPDTNMTRDLHSRWAAGHDPVEARVTEDMAAVSSLGAEAERLLVWMDCIYRVSRTGSPLYSTLDSIFSVIHRDDVAGQLLPTMVLPPNQLVHAIYAPLGVGHHVDHQIVRNWAIELHQQYPWVALNFYEEYPYREAENAIGTAQAFFETLKPPLQLTAELMPLDEVDVAAKVAAIGFYTSQISSFWLNKTAMEAAVRTSLNRTGGGQPAERLWRVV
jgi:LmbE family N-acetylglucosaminyl deacetylase